MTGRHDWHWTFGDRCHISFPNGGDPVVDKDHAFSSHEGCATFSDSAGNLLFYTDGDKLYDASHNVAGTGLGGSISSCHSAIIVPPAGGGKLYHIFAVYEWDNPGLIRPVTHTTVSVASGVAIQDPPTQLPPPVGPKRASEKLAAIPHFECDKYWVVAMHCDAPKIESSGAGKLYAMLVDSDLGVSLTKTSAYPWTDSWFGLCCKFSPDGSLLAMASQNTLDIMNFDRATGVVTGHSRIAYPPGDHPWGHVYGLEFSPNGKYLYLNCYFDGRICRHTIGPPTTTPLPFSSLAVLGQWPTKGSPRPFCIGALQLAPNGKIYGTKVTQKELFEIGDPDGAMATAAGVRLNLSATGADGNTLTMNSTADLGLPTFTRIADDCRREVPPIGEDRCARIAAEVNKQLAGRAQLHNQMAPCPDAQPNGEPDNPHDTGGTYGSQTPHGPPACTPLDLPEIRPWTAIRWGDSKCDCIEGDDTEIMYLTVCNPYSNITFSNLTVHQLEVLDGHGKPVPTLPDGSPSIQLVPIGPYCFDDIAPCTCVTRQFIVRLRGAPGGRYDIKLRGICFDICIHGDAEACFTFQVCKD